MIRGNPNNKMKRALGAACTLLLFLATPAHALDSLAVELGRGDDDLTLLRVAAQWRWDWRLASGGWHLGGYWEVSAGGWRGGNHDVYDIGVTPVFRFQRSEGGPYVEAAIGARVVSDRHVTRRDTFSTRYQFADHIGLGTRFGERNRYDLGLRLQHMSNGGIREPNPGINFLMLRLQRDLD
jgi:hypothetical protein